MYRNGYRQPIRYMSSRTADGYPSRFRAIITIGGTGDSVRWNSLSRKYRYGLGRGDEGTDMDGTVPSMMRRSRWWTPKKLPAITSPVLSPT
jgi:lipoprotein-anchoring transpeptidase ErfK/SrfK